MKYQQGPPQPGQYQQGPQTPQTPQQQGPPQQQTPPGIDALYNQIAGADDLTARLPYFPDEGDHKVRIEDIHWKMSENPSTPGGIFLIIEGVVEKSTTGWSGRAAQVINLTGKWSNIGFSNVKNIMLALAKSWYDDVTAQQWCENPDFHKAVVEKQNGLDPAGIYLYLRTYQKPNQSRPGQTVTVHLWGPYAGEVENVNIPENQVVSQPQPGVNQGPPAPMQVPQPNQYNGGKA